VLEVALPYINVEEIESPGEKYVLTKMSARMDLNLYFESAKRGLVGLQRLEAEGRLPHNRNVPVKGIKQSYLRNYALMKALCCPLLENEDEESIAWLNEAEYHLPKKYITKKSSKCAPEFRKFLENQGLINK